MRRPAISLHGRRLLALQATLALVALAAATPVGAASQPNLVRDINPTGSSLPSHLTAVGSTLFFAANDGTHGNELWKSDGTYAGTKMVKNIRPLAMSSDPENLVNVNGTLFFTAIDGVHGRELWKSDGTKAGTVMVKDLNTGKKNSYGGNSTWLHEGGAFAIGSRLFFLVDFCCLGTVGLFVSDGTAAGTRQIAGDPWMWMPENEDWWQDGMASAGTAGGKFYLVATESDFGSDYQLWVSDGTIAGTHTVAGSPTVDQMSIFPTNGGKLYFYANRVWRTDGTAAGTKPLTSVGAPNPAPTESAFMNSRLYFNGGALWKTDGTPAGTTVISSGQARWLAATSSRVFFIRGSHLWKTDGSASGTKDIGAFGAHELRAMAAVGNKVCFAEADWGNATWNLWKSDGSAAGTYQVASFMILGYGFSTGDGPIGTAVGSTLYFSAAAPFEGAELWSYTP